MTDDKRIELLAEILRSYAPTEKAARQVDNFILRSGTTEREILLDVASAVYNGITHYNWPWTIPVNQ